MCKKRSQKDMQQIKVCEECLSRAKNEYRNNWKQIYTYEHQNLKKQEEELNQQIMHLETVFGQQKENPNGVKKKSWQEVNCELDLKNMFNPIYYEGVKPILAKELVTLKKQLINTKSYLKKYQQEKNTLEWIIYQLTTIEANLDTENCKQCGGAHNATMIEISKANLDKEIQAQSEQDQEKKLEELKRNIEKLKRKKIEEEGKLKKIRNVSFLQEIFNLRMERKCNQINFEDGQDNGQKKTIKMNELFKIIKLPWSNQERELIKEPENLDSSINELAEKNIELQNQIMKLQKEVQDSNTSLDSMKDAKLMLERELQNKIKELEDQNLDLDLSSKEFAKQKTELQSQIKKLQKEVEDLNSSVVQIQNSRGSQENMLQDRIRQLEDQKRDLDSSNKELRKLEKKNTELQIQIKNLQKEVGELDQSKKSSEQKIKELEDQIRDLQSLNNDLGNKEIGLQNQITTLQEQLQRIREQTINQKIEPLQVELIENKEELSKLKQNQAMQLQQAIEDCKQEYELKISKEINDLVNKFYNFNSPIDETSTTNQIYRMILQTHSLNDLCNNGWVLSSDYPIIEQDKVYVSVIGSQSSGKTFLIQKLLGIASPETLSSFEGLRVANLSGVNFIDTKSFINPCPLEKVHSDLQYRFILNEKHKEIIFEFLTQISGIIIYVISNFSLLDQQIIDELRAQFTKKLIIVHNYSEIADKFKCQEKFQERLNNYFKVQEKFFPYQCEGNNKYFIDQENNQTWHLVLGKDNSDSGNFFNTSCLNFIKTQYIDSSSGSQKMNFKDTLFNLLKERLADQIEGITQDDIKVTETNDKNMEKYQYNFVIKKENNENGLDKNSNNIIKFKSLSSNHVRLLKNNAKALIPPYGLYIDETETNKSLYLIIEGASLSKDGLGVEINKSNHDFEIAVFGEKSIYPASLSQPKKIDDYRKATEFKFITKRIPIAEIDPSTNTAEYVKDYLDGNLIVKIPKRSEKKNKAHAI